MSCGQRDEIRQHCWSSGCSVQTSQDDASQKIRHKKNEKKTRIAKQFLQLSKQTRAASFLHPYRLFLRFCTTEAFGQGLLHTSQIA